MTDDVGLGVDLVIVQALEDVFHRPGQALEALEAEEVRPFGELVKGGAGIGPMPGSVLASLDGGQAPLQEIQFFIALQNEFLSLSRDAFHGGFLSQLVVPSTGK